MYKSAEHEELENFIDSKSFKYVAGVLKMEGDNFRTKMESKLKQFNDREAGEHRASMDVCYSFRELIKRRIEVLKKGDPENGTNA